MNTRYTKWTLLFVTVFLTACVSQVEPELTPIVPTSTRSVTVTPAVPIVSTVTKQLEATSSPTLQPQPSPTIGLVATLLPTVTAKTSTVDQGCPVLVDTNNLLVSSGSILFSTGRITSSWPMDDMDVWDPYKLGIWAISPRSSTPILAQAIPEDQPSLGYLSPDGGILLRFEFAVKSTLADKTAIFFDLRQQKELTRFHLRPYGSLEGYFWLPSGLVRGTNERTRIDWEGEDREYLILDPTTSSYEIMRKTYDLPNYTFLDTRDTLFEGYASVNPADNLILYTRGEEDWKSSVVLLSQETGEVIWEHPTESIGGLVVPVWNRDGSRVLFTISSPLQENQEENYHEFISLNTEGQVEELRGQPYPATDKGRLRHINWSADERYIHYAMWKEQITRGNGFIVDTVELKAGEICHPEGNFLTGVWATDTQFTYRITVGEEENERHQLYLLDVPSWRTQLLYEAPAKYGIHIVGGTSQEFE